MEVQNKNQNVLANEPELKIAAAIPADTAAMTMVLTRMLLPPVLTPWGITIQPNPSVKEAGSMS